MGSFGVGKGVLQGCTHGERLSLLWGCIWWGWGVSDGVVHQWGRRFGGLVVAC
ncbi:hypothetical protein [Xylella fastidiosa]|uniref:hypothetical protein n=1 Tax=Xylella fastidiosa TaxID=2371 RepID=UPI00040DC7F1|nr:hypothetical protein [Xylella fastidiosa]